MFLRIFPDSRVFMVEAQESKRTVLEQAAAAAGKRMEFDIALLGARDGAEVDFSEMETGSSVFAESSHFPRSVVRRRLTTLDQLLAGRGDFQRPQCLKLDTQGYELEVLRGARKTLATADVVLMEVSLLQINAGCPTFATVIEYMNEAGFAVFDFCSQIRRTDGVLWQTDLMFVRKDGAVRIDPRLTAQTWG